MKIVRFSVVVILLLLSLTSPSVATTITGMGKSDVGTSVQFSADMSITGNNLIIILNNTSSVSSTAYNDALSSFFFDIVQNGIRPTLTLTSATGTVYKGVKSRNDTLYKSNYNLDALTNPGTWQYKTFNANDFIASTGSAYGFGLGTTGNNSLPSGSPLTGFPGTFKGKLVGNAEYSIYKGDETNSSLDNKLLVGGPATFTFTISGGTFTNADIQDTAVFGLGSAPDSLLIVPPPKALSQVPPVPEPATLILFGTRIMVGAGMLRRAGKKR